MDWWCLKGNASGMLPKRMPPERILRILTRGGYDMRKADLERKHRAPQLPALTAGRPERGNSSTVGRMVVSGGG